MATVITAVAMKMTVAVTGSAAVAEPGTEADQQPRRDDDGPARRQFRRRHPVADRTGNDRRQNEPRDEGDSPALVLTAQIQEAREYPADPGDPAGQQHQQHGREPDQGPADRGGYRGEIAHEDFHPFSNHVDA
jgi:hypothetical protein